MLRMNLMCVAILLSCSLASLHAVASAFSPCRNCISQKYRGPRLSTTLFNSDSDSDTTSSNAFTASPITITSEIPSAASKSNSATTKVNSATLQFNNRLNRMAKSVDATTAPKVEALLLDAVKKYQQSQIENEQGGQKNKSNHRSQHRFLHQCHHRMGTMHTKRLCQTRRSITRSNALPLQKRRMGARPTQQNQLQFRHHRVGTE